MLPISGVDDAVMDWVVVYLLVVISPPTGVSQIVFKAHD